MCIFLFRLCIFLCNLCIFLYNFSTLSFAFCIFLFSLCILSLWVMKQQPLTPALHSCTAPAPNQGSDLTQKPKLISAAFFFFSPLCLLRISLPQMALAK